MSITITINISTDKPDTSAAYFSVGDYVVFVGRYGFYALTNGKVYEVLDVYVDGDIKIEDDLGDLDFYNAAEFRPATFKEVETAAASATFVKDEDFVVYTGPPSDCLTNGKVYVVVDVDDDGDIEIEDDFGDLDLYGAADFRLATDKEVETAAAAFVTDEDFVVYSGPPSDFLTNGQVYEVLDVVPCGCIELEDDDGDLAYLSEGFFRLATDEEIEEAGFSSPSCACGLWHDDGETEELDFFTKPTHAERQFYSRSADRTILESELRSLLEEHGQRGTSRLTGIPRTTLQNWIYELDA